MWFSASKTFSFKITYKMQSQEVTSVHFYHLVLASHSAFTDCPCTVLSCKMIESKMICCI